MTQDIDDVIRHIARQEGLARQQVIDEMQKAIDAAYDNPDPAVQGIGRPCPSRASPRRRS